MKKFYVPNSQILKKKSQLISPTLGSIHFELPKLSPKKIISPLILKIIYI